MLKAITSICLACMTLGGVLVLVKQDNRPAEKPAAVEISVTDALGRNVVLAQTPQRPACLVSFASEMLLALGVKPILRPEISEEQIFPPEAKEIPAMSLNHSAGPDLESLAAAKPDLVIVSPIFARFIDTLEKNLKVPVLALKIDHVDQVPRMLELLGRVMHREEQAKKLAEAHLKVMSAAYEGAPDKPIKVLALFGTPQSFLGFLPESYLGSMLKNLHCEVVGAIPGKESIPRQTAPLSLETIVAADPDVILWINHGPLTPALEMVQNEAAWKDLRAVKAGRVHRISEWLYMLSPGLRAEQAVRELCGLLLGESSSERQR